MKRVIFLVGLLLIMGVVNSRSSVDNYTFIIDSVEYKMVYIKGGEYDMVGKFLLSDTNFFTKANDIWYLG